eukprot:11187052-Lingulodinium_polyedra.AAC.1
MKGVWSNQTEAGLHSTRDAVFCWFGDFVESRQPRGVIIEEVAELAKFDREVQGSSSPLERCLSILAGHCWFSQPVLLDAKDWVQMPCPRVWVSACSPDIGGEA